MIELVIDSRRRRLGPGGFEVGRVLPFSRRRMVGPFIYFDQMGPAELPVGLPEEMDVWPHPHIGLSTLTYLFDGEIMHRDSLGTEQAIRPGEVNWMTAGRGITHSERFEYARRYGGPMHGIQAWVALPDEAEECAPAFAHHEGLDLPSLDGRGSRGRLVAGRLLGQQASVETRSPLFFVHWELEAGAEVELPAEYPERAVYVVSGVIELAGQRLVAGQLAVLESGQAVAITAFAPSIVIALGGAPVGPRYINWNFVSSSQERIAQARADWSAGRMKLPNLDNERFIPLPASPFES